MFANRLRHLEHAQSGFSKDWLQLSIGYNFPPLLWVLQLMFLDVGPHLLATYGRDIGAADPSTSAYCGEETLCLPSLDSRMPWFHVEGKGLAAVVISRLDPFDRIMVAGWGDSANTNLRNCP